MEDTRPSSEEPLLSGAQDVDSSPLIGLALKLSWLVNWVMLALKLYASVMSGSKAVLASMADSAVDLASRLLLSVAERFVPRRCCGIPTGRDKLEALAVLSSACIMTVASLGVAQSSALDLYAGLVKGEVPVVDLSWDTFATLGSGIVVKLALFFFCNWFKDRSDSMRALAQDHINDAASNTSALLSTVVTKLWPAAWLVDGVSAIVIALATLGRWSVITYTQVLKIVGQAAPEEFRERVERIAEAHHALVVDITRAYPFGSRFNVEVEVVLPAGMLVAESHDLVLGLQHKLEALDQVERAFVHVVYQQGSSPEHKVERNLILRHLERVAARQGGSAV